MANRVVLDSNGLRVSMPGQNVLTQNPWDLLFTSEYACLGVVEEGTHTVSWASSGTSGSYNQSVYFGAAFSSVPATLMSLVIDSNQSLASSGGEIYIARDVLVQVSGQFGSVADYELRSITHADRIQFTGRWARNSIFYEIPNLTISWKVFAYNY